MINGKEPTGLRRRMASAATDKALHLSGMYFRINEVFAFLKIPDQELKQRLFNYSLHCSKISDQLFVDKLPSLRDLLQRIRIHQKSFPGTQPLSQEWLSWLQQSIQEMRKFIESVQLARSKYQQLDNQLNVLKQGHRTHFDLIIQGNIGYQQAFSRMVQHLNMRNLAAIRTYVSPPIIIRQIFAALEPILSDKSDNCLSFQNMARLFQETVRYQNDNKKTFFVNIQQPKYAITLNFRPSEQGIAGSSIYPNLAQFILAFQNFNRNLFLDRQFYAECCGLDQQAKNILSLKQTFSKQRTKQQFTVKFQSIRRRQQQLGRFLQDYRSLICNVQKADINQMLKKAKMSEISQQVLGKSEQLSRLVLTYDSFNY